MDCTLQAKLCSFQNILTCVLMTSNSIVAIPVPFLTILLLPAIAFPNPKRHLRSRTHILCKEEIFVTDQTRPAALVSSFAFAFLPSPQTDLSLLDHGAEQLSNCLGTLLGIPLPAVQIIDIGTAKPCFISLCPFKVAKIHISSNILPREGLFAIQVRCCLL